MHVTASVLSELLKSDLDASGWDGSTVPDLGKDPRQFAMGSLATSLTKKFIRGSKVPKDLEAATLELFLDSNERCRGYIPPPFRQYCGDWWTQTWDVELYGEVKSILHGFFNAPEELPNLRNSSFTTCNLVATVNPNSLGEMYEGQVFPVLTTNKIFRGLDVGPGSSIGASETDFFTKLSQSPMTYTSDRLLSCFQQMLHHNPTWAAAEAERAYLFGYREVVGSKLSFVPKSAKIARTICTEPILNMLFQKGISKILRRRLDRYFGIDLSRQPEWNAHLAWSGSISGGFATIDLKSASDTISLSLVRDLIDEDNFRFIDMARSPSTTLPGGEIVQLDMVASMGNDFTFPLQTAIFTAIVHAVYRQNGLIPVRPNAQFHGNYGVFGDDIIVDSRVYLQTCRALELFGFVVNMDKSFFTGDFRESCGSDYYQGHNVRGIYLQKLDHERDFLSAFNRLIIWSARWRVPLIRLLSFLRKGFRWLPVPPDESDDAGVKVPVNLAPSYERGPLMKGYKKARRSGSWLYRYHYNVPRRRNLVPISTEGKHPNGLLLAVIAGRVSDGFIGLRSNTVKTVIRVRMTPRWGYVHSARLTPDEEWRWQSLLLELL